MTMVRRGQWRLEWVERRIPKRGGEIARILVNVRHADLQTIPIMTGLIVEILVDLSLLLDFVVEGAHGSPLALLSLAFEALLRSTRSLHHMGLSCTSEDGTAFKT